MSKPKNANMQKGLKKLGNKKTRAYVPENLEYFAKTLQQIRKTKDGEQCYFRPSLANLQKAIESLPKKEQQNIEKFWGLTGGINHSKRNVTAKDSSFIQMRSMAVEALRLLFRLEYVVIYDEYIKARITRLIKKINRKCVEISDLDAIKYLLVFQVILLNGPKMCYETDPLAIDPVSDESFEDKEYSAICELSRMFEVIPDNSINLKLLIDWVENLDLKDALCIKKTFRIAIPKDFLKEEIEIFKIIPKDFMEKEIEVIRTLPQVRLFKARVFSYGPWNLTSELVFGNPDGEINLEGLMGELDMIRKDWSKIARFKTSEMALKVVDGIRHLNVYNIGELEILDPDEVRFLYLERNFITPLIPNA